MSEIDEKDNMTNSALSIDKRDPGFWREAYQQVRLVFRLLADRDVPFYLKLLPFTAVLYFLWPADLIPGAILPFIGGLDDVTALLVGAKVFIELAPQPVVIKHINAIREQDGFPPIDEEIAAASSADDDIIIIDGEVIQEKDPD